MRRLLNIIQSIHSNPFSVKVVITVVMFAAVSCTIVLVNQKTNLSRVLFDQLEQKGKALAVCAVEKSTINTVNADGTIVVKRQADLNRVSQDLHAIYQDLNYMIFFDRSGQVLAHSFDGAIPPQVLHARASLSGAEPGGPAYDTEAKTILRGAVLDIIIPMPDHERAEPIAGQAGQDVQDSGNPIGSIRVGLSTRFIDQNLFAFSQNLILTTIILTIIGVFGALLVAHLVTRPITDLSIASRKIAEGDLTQRVTTWGEDELAKLGKNFNRMASSIESYTIEREALVKQLRHNEQVRQELLKKVITAQEDERKRISRELHDETSQSLTSIIIGLKLLGNMNLQQNELETINDLKNLASVTLREVHRLAVELRPTVLDDMGLIPAIERYIQNYSSAYNLDVDFHRQGKAEARLPGEVETALYRIVQEALTNIARYAKAENVSVLLDTKDDGVKLIIDDDGIGFNYDQIAQSDTHLGIAGMTERTHLLGGTFHIETEPHQGTTLYIFLPLKGREYHVENTHSAG